MKKAKPKDPELNDLDVMLDPAEDVLSYASNKKPLFVKQMALALTRADVRKVITRYRVFKDQLPWIRLAAKRAKCKLVLDKAESPMGSHKIMEVVPL